MLRDAGRGADRPEGQAGGLRLAGGEVVMSAETLQEVTQVAVLRHPRRGVLLLHSASRRWHFPDATVRVHESWDQSLRRGVEADTGIADLLIRSVLRIQNFPPGSVHEVAQYGVFFLCTTATEA